MVIEMHKTCSDCLRRPTRQVCLILSAILICLLYIPVSKAKQINYGNLSFSQKGPDTWAQSTKIYKVAILIGNNQSKFLFGDGKVY